MKFYIIQILISNTMCTSFIHIAYLREPQATPLAPATHSSSRGIIDSIQNNPILVIVSSIAILLLFLLLIALLLMGRSHVRHKNEEINR